jgi:hypothetical protein
MKAKSTLLAWNVLPSLTWAPGSPNDEGPGLPMAAHGGNVSPERRIIRWMSVKSKPGSHVGPDQVKNLTNRTRPYLALCE